MVAWTSPRTWLAGEDPTATLFNQQLRDNMLHLIKPPYSNGHQNADVSIASSGVWTDVTTWTIDASDATTYAAGVWTVPTAGRYLCFATVSIAANTTGTRGLRPVVNGVVGQNILTPVVTTAGFQTTVALYNELVVGAGQTVKYQVYQNSGGALNLRGDAAGLFSTAGVRRLGDT